MSLRARAEVAWKRRSAATGGEEGEAVAAGADLFDYAEARRMGVSHAEVMEVLTFRDLGDYLRLRREGQAHDWAAVKAKWKH